MINIAINGIDGKMGQMIYKEGCANKNINITAIFEQENHPKIGQKIDNLIICDKESSDVDSFSIIIDFTRPIGTLEVLEFAKQHNKKVVIGTTGFEKKQKQQLIEYSKTIPIVFAPNMSIGVNVTFALLKKAAELLQPDYDIEIIEAHHKNKVDAPSGTALKMGQVIAETLNVNFDEKAIMQRVGNTGVRPDGSIGFSTIRAADIVGEHTAIFATSGERIEISHKATNRYNFAKGACVAALWLQDKKPGLYDMSDVLRI
jgi:4-hydroxy-tetrahydrodipicolinate reductase